ncbi:MAG: hypothetical protein AB8B58_15515 [Roseobacter sp.]
MKSTHLKGGKTDQTSLVSRKKKSDDINVVVDVMLDLAEFAKSIGAEEVCLELTEARSRIKRVIERQGKQVCGASCS